MLQSVKTFFSPDDVEKGSCWNISVAKELDEVDFGLLFITKNNFNNPWLVFEAGALSKKLNTSNVCPVLYDIDPTDVEGPVAQFQSIEFDKKSVYALIQTLNKYTVSPLTDTVLESTYNMWWKKLEETTKEILKKCKSQDSTPNKAIRNDRDLLEEILQISRRNVSQIDKVEYKTSLIESIYLKGNNKNINSFTRSSGSFYAEIFPHYLSQENNFLDYVAYCKGDSVIGDNVHPLFGERLKKHNVSRDPEIQIEKYKDLAKHYFKILDLISNELNISEVEQGSLLKVAFDLEVGGIFYYLFDNDESGQRRYLFGSTVDQKSMDDGIAYQEMELIFEDLGGKKTT